MSFKERLYQHCFHLLSERVEEAARLIDDAQEASNSEPKAVLATSTKLVGQWHSWRKNVMPDAMRKP